MKRAGIYARVSMADQHCEMQIHELREWLTRRGWELVTLPQPDGWKAHTFKPRAADDRKPGCASCGNVEVHAVHTGRYGEYIDSGFSGAKARRPELDRAMRDARSLKLDGIVVWKLDRWGRSLSHCIDSIEELRKLGRRWIATTQNLDTEDSSPMSRAMFGMMSVFAEFEREMIRERVTAGVKHHRDLSNEGRIGRDKHTKSGKDLRIGGQPKIFDRKRAREWHLSGMSLRKIRAKFLAEGIKVSLGTIQGVCREKGVQ